MAIVADSFGLVFRLRQKRFSIVIDFQGYGETAWLSWLSNARERWGRVGRRSRGVNFEARVTCRAAPQRSASAADVLAEPVVVVRATGTVVVP